MSVGRHVIAYRAWVVAPTPDGWRLCSHAHPTGQVWAPGWSRFDCRGCGKTFRDDCVRGCGLWASASPDASYARRARTRGMAAYGQVRLAGTIISTHAGLRAERARPLKVTLTPDVPAEALADLVAAYGDVFQEGLWPA